VFVDGDLGELDEATLARMRGETVHPLRVPHGAPPEVVGRLHRLHWEHQQAQGQLREVIAWWAGWRDAVGETTSQSYRRFYLQFGVDVLSAQALPTKDAEALKTKIADVLRQNNIDGFVNTA
jgi:hypothetical protein